MYGGFWRRFAAAILDLFIVALPMTVLSIIVALITGPMSRATAITHLSIPVVLWLYFAIMESRRAGATVGKRVFGLRVADLAGERISFFRASARFFSKIFSVLSLGFGFLAVPFTRRKQALHDAVTGCLVLRWEATAADLKQHGFAQPLTAGRIVALVLAAVLAPAAAAGTAVAVPFYQDYLVRSKLKDAIEIGRAATFNVTAYMLQHKVMPRSLEEARATVSSPHLREAVITRNGTIVLTLAIDKLDGKRVAFVPSTQKQEKLVWTCTSDEIAQRYLPRQCRARR
jgi:uncharacterized RDD family membrane protein YckC